MRRPSHWLLPLTLLALLAPASSRALEVLVLTTPTEVAYSGEAYEVKNQGPASIWCQRGSGDGLAIGRGREIVPGGEVRVAGALQKLYCLAVAAQVTGSATVVTPGIANTGGEFDPSCATTAADLDPYVGTSITAITPLVGAKDFTILPDGCAYDCRGAWDPILPSTVAPLRGFLIQAGSTAPLSFGRGSALGTLRIACTGVNCHFHVQRCY